MKKLTSLIISLVTILLSAQGQTILKPEEAVAIAMKNSYDILISRSAADISKTNNTAGNAGMLPNIGITGSDVYALNNSSLEFSSGTTSSSANANSNSFNAAIALNWTLFDGGRMFVTKKKLSQIEAYGELQYKDKVLQTIYNVIVAYYDVVRQRQQLASINEVIKYNRERVKILQASFNAGLVPKTDLLQSQVDLNVYLENAIAQETIITGSKRTLNQLLSRDPDTPLEVIDTIELNYTPDAKNLTDNLYSVNTQVLSGQKQLDISGQIVKEIAAQRYPWLSASASYNYLLSNNTIGSVLKNNTYGPQFGGVVTMPIWYGSNINRQVKVAKLQVKAAEYNLENSRIQVRTQLQNALTEYEHEMQLLRLERDNTALAKENLTISMQRLRLGQTTMLEVRQAEDSYEQSMTRRIFFEYSAKVTETRLKQLMSAL
jgi:outer membrane protein